MNREELKQALIDRLYEDFTVQPQDATEAQIYKALSTVIMKRLKRSRKAFIHDCFSKGRKHVYYLSMEFLMGRSLKTSLYNLGLQNYAADILEEFGVSLEKIYECEPDAGLGNGGLGRLAACYLDGLATEGYPAMGYSICYEYGIFKQRLENGWQTELPDNWLPGGEVWLAEKTDRTVEIHFDGEAVEYWDEGYHHVSYKNQNTVLAVPYDMYVSGYGNKGVSVLRVWQARVPSIDMNMFNQGDYTRALGQNNIIAQAISKVLYPNDNHLEGKSLRLRQQYFLCAASVGDIVNQHMSVYGTLDNLHEKVSIHINDTHPTLAIPELMRILMDDCGYGWNQTWHIVQNTFAYTNHTVMAEALEKWDMNLVRAVIPRIYNILCEINRRYCEKLRELGNDEGQISRKSMIQNGQVHMALLCVEACHSVNGVSRLHSEIIKQDVFRNQYQDAPHKFKNVTNGIAYRRWLYQSNPGLTNLLKDTIGDSFLKDARELKKFGVFAGKEEIQKQMAAVKRQNKEAFAKYVKQTDGVVLNPESIFDVQVKRLHEYKRQHLNALNILAEYNALLWDPNLDFTPKTYIFAAKAAPGYFLAKQIIKMIWAISEELRKNPKINEKLTVHFLEDYRVTLSEKLMPAAEISEQISLAGTEASGTGNMKLMLNGAITIGTLDGANVEILEQVGKDNILIFGMDKQEVLLRKTQGYRSEDYYNGNDIVRGAINRMYNGINGCTFDDVANSLRYSDPYMVLADFDAYQQIQKRASELYRKPDVWNCMSIHNVAEAGVFSADRAVEDYARDIWNLRK